MNSAAVAGGQADLALSFEPTVSQAVVDRGSCRCVVLLPRQSGLVPLRLLQPDHSTEKYLRDNP